MVITVEKKHLQQHVGQLVPTSFELKTLATLHGRKSRFRGMSFSIGALI
jgi:hypothetical protein